MVSFSGIGSGVDWSALIDGYVQAEKIPITTLEAKKTSTNQELTTIGSLVSRLQALSSAAEALQTPADVRSMSATASRDDLTATVSDAASPGRYEVRVNHLARAQVDHSQAFSSNGIGVAGAGGLVITAGDADPVSISLTGTETLAEVAAAINDSDANVTASVLNDGTGWRLAIQGQSAQAVTLAPVGTNLSFGTTVQARQAELEVDGLTVTRDSNRISDLFDGITLELNSETEAGETFSVEVKNDVKGLQDKVQTFLDAYNQVAGLISLELRSSGPNARPMAGDSTLQSLQRRLSGVVSGGYDHDGGTVSLGAVGIKLANDGGLSIDATKFEAAMESDPTALSSLLAGDGETSLTALLKDVVTNYTESGTGILRTKQSSLNDRLEGYDDQIERIENRASRLETRLRTSYASLDSNITELNSQLNAITAAFFGSQS